MLISEQRFREGTGVRYLDNGNVRCQAISVSASRRWREEFDDYDTPIDQLWPECQCSKPVVPGLFVCKFHGGWNKPKEPKSIADVMPVDLGEKFKLLMEDPIYMSRREGIALMRARQWELLENIAGGIGNPEAWGLVSEALHELEQGDESKAANRLKEALSSANQEHRAWKEVYQLEKLLDDTTSTEVRTAATLKTMATAEQVARLVARVYDIVMNGAQKYIDDRQQQVNFLSYVAGELGRATNFSPATIGGLIESGSRAIIRDSE